MPNPQKPFRVAVDVGGTFTDVAIVNTQTNELKVAKVPSTPDDPMRAVMDGLQQGNVALNQVEVFSHGTTVATNALIQRRFPQAALVTTKGFRDVLEIRDGTKDELWDAYEDVGDPYIRRRDRYEVTERIDYDGVVVEPLNEDEARDLARILARKKVETVAICFINSHANAAHEERMAEILREELPDASISTSSEILPEIFEYERFSTTVSNAVLAPLVAGYVNRLSQQLAEGGYEGDLLLLHSGGGSMTPQMVTRYPVRLAASGIAAGAIAVQDIATRCGYRNALGLEMGGTSTDIALVYEGDIRITKQWQVEYGFPITFPSIEVGTIGAGGGSLAWIDEAGSLRNGPQSAGADPGPVCYERGGTDATNTDANVVLGRLGTALIGGELQLNKDAAREAVRTTVAEPLGLDLETAAEDIIKVANANMADAVRLLSIRRGYDPRDFVLVVGGGAGALHGAEVARDLSIPTVVVPPHPGVTSAQGCLLVDIRHDLSKMYQAAVEDINSDELRAAYKELATEARERLAHEGVPQERMKLKFTASMRYRGQWRSLTVEIPDSESPLADAIELFHDEHEREYSFSRRDGAVEFYQIGLVAIGELESPPFARYEVHEHEAGEPETYRDVYFSSNGGWARVPVYQRTELSAGARLHGPAIIDQFDATTVIPPGDTAEIDEWSNIRIHIGAADNS
ncbi:hydantoinase/oxoprolinase family protein [Corynebacterium sp.]|uniref:hydantoinase/oxoprolinase family protein n=1 Tax=Corynebacterium sp. TaxID=1720 RepID=UPI0026DB52EF|nr:hydantoinase/oxoprolinase family protein [Corynebacterium sp.]MDO5032134.1 hydantoinase/oxoprolinase family protein [Corynebacterium sp.]